ncbi:MAG: M4 family metallopeptidase [Eubacterium sp.]|nr:M4 family metallopeptidase [Eubacterium sp.]
MKVGKVTRVITAFLLTGMLALATACGNSSESSTNSNGQAEHKYDPSAITGEGIVNTFLSENISDEVIKDENDALKVIQGVMDKIGGDSTTVLQAETIRPTDADLTYYTFSQFSGDVKVHGASVKLIVGKDGKAVGLTSAILPNVKTPNAEEWGLSEEQAEAIVEKSVDGGLTVVKGSSEVTLLPMGKGVEVMTYAWVVYTQTSDNAYDTAYKANYVSMLGEYLYSIPVQEKGSNEAKAGSVSGFAFDSGTSETWTGELTHVSGKKEQVSIPVIKTTEGKYILADAKRKILCADFVDFMSNQTLTPTTAVDNSFNNHKLLIYYNMIRIYDYFEKYNWEGADGIGTHILLLMDAVQADGKSSQNAWYQGFERGFQVFGFCGDLPLGDCVDVMAHEYTHCITGSFMTENLYLNDYGAINEALSDIVGNLVEIGFNDDGTTPWVIGENSKIFLRDMKEPHKGEQPEYVGDRYYMPAVVIATENNDYGGVHTNSSLLNYISYKLHEAGMSTDEQMYLWLNVAMAITPRTDYPEIAKILPWSLQQTGLDKYADVLNAAIETTGIASHKMSDKIPEGMGKVTMNYDFLSVLNENQIKISLENMIKEGADATSWPSAIDGQFKTVVGEGEYAVHLEKTDAFGTVTRLIYMDGKWVDVTADGALDELLKDAESVKKTIIKVENGKTLELSSEGLKTALEK